LTSVATAPHVEQAPDGRDPGATNEADDAAKGYPRRVKEQRRHELWLLKLTGRFTDGTVELPDIETVKELEEAGWEKTLNDLEAVSTQSEGRGRTAMTAAAFAFTIAGILLAAESKVSPQVVAGIGVVAFLGFACGLLGQAFYVGRRPMRDLCIQDVTNGLVFTTHKEFYAQVSMFLAALALSAEMVGFVVAYT
jgi:hypothetical protein